MHTPSQSNFSRETCLWGAGQAPPLRHCCSTMALVACQALPIQAPAALALLKQCELPCGQQALEHACAGGALQLMAYVLCRLRHGSASWNSRGRLVSCGLARARNLGWAGGRCGPGDQPLWQECGHGGCVQPAHGGGRWVGVTGCPCMALKEDVCSQLIQKVKCFNP